MFLDFSLTLQENELLGLKGVFLAKYTEYLPLTLKIEATGTSKTGSNDVFFRSGKREKLF